MFRCAIVVGGDGGGVEVANTKRGVHDCQQARNTPAVHVTLNSTHQAPGSKRDDEPKDPGETRRELHQHGQPAHRFHYRPEAAVTLEVPLDGLLRHHDVARYRRGQLSVLRWCVCACAHVLLTAFGTHEVCRALQLLDSERFHQQNPSTSHMPAQSGRDPHLPV